MNGPRAYVGVGSVAELVTFKYRAFLSYSHRDKAWGKWLHAALEGHRIGSDLIGRETPVGPVPGRTQRAPGLRRVPWLRGSPFRRAVR
jgi:hypothetical protein